MNISTINAVARGFFLGLSLGALLGFCAVFWVGVHVGMADMRERATKAGVAHWAVDPVTGETTFTWERKTPCP